MNDHNQMERDLANVHITSKGKLDAFVNGDQVIDTDYAANLSDGILSLETTTNGRKEADVVDLRDLFEHMSRKDSLKTILLEIKNSEDRD